MKQKKRKAILVLAMIFAAMGLQTMQAQVQNGSTHTATATYVPSSNGYEVNVTLNYQFIWCVDAIKVVVSLVSEEAVAYRYNGKSYSAAEVGGFNSPKSVRIGTLDASAKLYHGRAYRGTRSLTNLVYGWGGCLGDTHDVFNGNDAQTYKNNLPEFSFSGFTVNAKYVDYEIESKLKTTAQLEEYKSNGDKLFNQGKYEEAKAEYQKILKEKPDDSHAKNKIAECDKKIEEAKKKEEEDKDKVKKEDADDTNETSTTKAKSAEEMEREYRQERQRQYDSWLSQERQHRSEMASEMAGSSIGMLVMIGGFMYNGMGNVNPKYVYLNYDNSFKWFAGMDLGYSMSIMPSMFSSDKNTMKNGYNVNIKSIEPSTAFTINLDYKARFGFENNNLGGYAYWAPKAGFSPIFNAYQLFLPNFGANLYGGAKWIKGFAEFEWGERRFWQNGWTDPEESGSGNIKISYRKITYGLKFSTNPDGDYKRNHFLIGIIHEKVATKNPYTMTIYKDGALLAPHKRGNAWLVMQNFVGYTFQWKYDHTNNLYVNVYPSYPYTGKNIHGTMGTSESIDKFRKGGLLLEAGFLRSFDWFGSVYKNTESDPDNSRRFIAFSADLQAPLGISYGKIDPQKWELYLSACINPNLLMSYPKVGGSEYTEKLSKLQRENPGMTFNNPSYDEKLTRYEAANFTLGITKSVTDLWWIYAGAGVAYSKPVSRERLVDRVTSAGRYDGKVSLGQFAGSTGVTGENRIFPQIEAGAMYLYQKYIATAGVRSDFSGVYPSIGIGITW